MSIWPATLCEKCFEAYVVISTCIIRCSG